tara:strand:+ start:1950 stop:3056 length:1107 start_codon:yes stop_codon:yes gene_type:complete
MFELDRPYIDGNEIKYLTEAINSGWISSQGPFVKKFEKMFADYIGVKYAISCFSGTSALMLLSPTFNLQKDDEIITQSMTFSAVGFAMKQSGVKIVFADCSKNKFTLSPEDVKKKITNKTKIINPTHLYGRPAEMDELKEICDKKNIFLVEDCCQAVGADYKNKKVGSIGHFNFFSFHNKLIASGEGGMITTNDRALAERFDNLKNPPAVNRPEERNGFSEISMNHRMSNLHAAVGVAQLERLENTIEKKIKMAKLYDEHFKSADGIKVVKADTWSRTVYWRYTILLDEKIDQRKFIKEASKLGITARETYLPLHLHPLFRKENKISLPNCEKMSKSGVDIPSSIKLSEKDIDLIAKNLKIIAKKLLS